jgi:hypothetical protein
VIVTGGAVIADQDMFRRKIPVQSAAAE